MARFLGEAEWPAFGLPAASAVLQPSGWTNLNQLVPGDAVVDVDGRACRVRRVVPCGVGPAIEVRLRDGTAVTMGVDQQLPILVGPERVPLTCSARRVSELLSRRTTVRLANCQPVDMPVRKLPIDPFTLGLLLGDGCVTTDSVILWSTEEDLVRKFEQGLPAGSRLSDHPRRQERCTGWAVVGQERGPGKNTLLQALRALDLAGVKADQKFIPASYSWSSSRLEVLRGLCDTDAGIDPWGRLRFSTASEALAADVALIVRTLGGRCTTHRRESSYTVAGQTGARKVKDSFKVDIRLPDINVFTLQRKAERVRPTLLATQWSIGDIREAGVARLLSVETTSPTGTYLVGDGFVPVASAEAYTATRALAA